jgi:hypothetical protein
MDAIVKAVVENFEQRKAQYEAGMITDADFILGVFDFMAPYIEPAVIRQQEQKREADKAFEAAGFDTQTGEWRR